LEEIANGVEKKVKVKRKVQAPGDLQNVFCNGQGQVMRVTNTILEECQLLHVSTCGGSNLIKTSKLILRILRMKRFNKIPAGVVDGMQLKVSNKGNDAQETVFQEI
jgi:molecular chaperone DnaJ